MIIEDPSYFFEELFLFDFDSKEVLEGYLEKTDDIKPGCGFFSTILLDLSEKDFNYLHTQFYLPCCAFKHRPEHHQDLLYLLGLEFEEEVRNYIFPEG